MFFSYDPSVKIWVKNAVLSLALAGFYSIFIVFLRTPLLKDLFSPGLFKSSLVAHVNLSVLVWLFSVICAIWSSGRKKKSFVSIFCGRVCAISTFLIALSPFSEAATPFMNDYVPISSSLFFLSGLSIFAASTFIYGVYVFLTEITSSEPGILRLFKISSFLILFLSWLCFLLSYLSLKKISGLVPLEPEFFYELLFWSGGHGLQFFYSHGLIIVWFLLLGGGGSRFRRDILILNFILAVPIIFGHFLYDIESFDFREYYTLHMKYAGGIAPAAAFFVCALRYVSLSTRKKKEIPAFPSSSFLFIGGGFVGIAISGTNVTVPAHYHGCIVGISLAFMGLVYLILDIKGKFMAAQIYSITLGQAAHIFGLALAGGYGIMRKTTLGEADPYSFIYMGIMGIGGLVAILGGLGFVFIVSKKLLSKRDYGAKTFGRRG